MSEFESTTLARLAETGIIAVLRAPTPESALGTVQALVAGGITGIEVTYSTPGAAAVIAECTHRYGTNILLGAGTVTTAAQAEEAATGLGQDRPGSPLSDQVVFPERGLIWDFNYRGSLEFLHQAQRQQHDRDLVVEDGWRYFIHGWTQVVAD